MKYDVNVRKRENMIAPVNIFLNKKRGCIKIPIHPLFISIGKECI